MRVVILLRQADSCLFRQKVHSKVLLHANPTPGHLPPNPDCALERANDAIDERRHISPGKYEPANEPARATAYRDGVREGKRCYGPAAGDDG